MKTDTRSTSNLAECGNKSKPLLQDVFISTYGFKKDWSYRGEEFYFIPLTWKLGVSNIEALKIRISKWKPKFDRENQAIFYFDVETKEEAKLVLDKFKAFNFKKLEDKFDSIFNDENVRLKNSGETKEWLLNVIPLLRTEFSEYIL